MSSLVILNNPLIFMSPDYIKDKLIKGKYAKGEIISIIQNEIPIKIIFKFSEQPLIDEFISDYNDKPISDSFNYKLSLSKETKSEDEIKKNFPILC